MIAHLLHFAGVVAMVAFIAHGGPFMAYRPDTRTEREKLEEYVKQDAFSDCQTDSDIVNRARQLGLNLDKLHREGVFPF